MSDLKSETEALKKAKAEEFASACPSRVIEMALEDLEAVEDNPKYQINMLFWHDPMDEGECAVCFAGGVMAMRLGLPSDKAYCEQFDAATECRLLALNDFRCGEIYLGLELMGVAAAVSLPSFQCVTRYHDSPTQFKSDMRSLAEMLKKKGL